MHVEVDEAREDVEAGAIDLVRGFGGAAAVGDGDVGVADAADVGDAVVFDHDVDRAAGRGARTIDHGDAADDHAVVGALAFIGAAVRGAMDGDDLRVDQGGEEEEENGARHVGV